MEPEPDCSKSYHQYEKLSCLLCNIYLSRSGEPVDANADSFQTQPSPESKQEQADEHGRETHACDNAELTNPIKVEVIDEEGQMLGWSNCFSQEQEEEQPTAATWDNTNELLRFLRSHFNMPAADRTHFCGSCSGRIRFLHKLWMQLSLLQKEFRKLSSEIDTQYKNACLTRKHMMQAHESEFCQLEFEGNPSSDLYAEDLILRQNHTDSSAVSFAPHEQMSSTECHSDEEWAPIPSPAVLVNNILQKDSKRQPTTKRRKRTSKRTNVVTKIVDELPVPLTDPASVPPCVVKLERLQSSTLALPSKDCAPTRTPPSTADQCPPKRKRRKQDPRKGGPFRCSYCPKLLTTLHGRSVHHRIHTGETPYACKLCGKKFYKCSSLTTHLMAHDSLTKNYVCHTCGSKFAVKHLLTIHLESVHGLSENYSCTVCSETFKLSKELKKHVAAVHSVKPKNPRHDGRRSRKRHYDCDACAGSFESKKLLKEHHMKEHNIGETGEGLLNCKDCRREFVNETNYNQHVAVCKQLIDSKEVGRTKRHLQRLVCPVCGRCFSGTANLHNHIQSQHEGVRPFQCSICPMKFAFNNCLRLHMLKHTGQKAFACDYCEETFCRLVKKREHLVKVHPDQYLTKDRPVHCVHCWVNFPSEDDLPPHFAKIHAKFTCRTCDPVKVFPTLAKYKNHLITHTGEKPFQCPQCPKAFNLKENLQEHVHRHADTRPHICEYCGVGFFRKKELGNHVQKTHAEAAQGP